MVGWVEAAIVANVVVEFLGRNKRATLKILEPMDNTACQAIPHRSPTVGFARYSAPTLARGTLARESPKISHEGQQERSALRTGGNHSLP